VKRHRTSVGLDVHARSVLGCALDGDTGEVLQRRLCPDHGEIVAWLSDLPGPVAVTYEAGPTGFGLARALTAAGILCEVAAPSKLIRPAGDRVKTDARNAAHLARLLHLVQYSRASSGVSQFWLTTCWSLVRARWTLARMDSAVAVQT
jgi:transposase